MSAIRIIQYISSIVWSLPPLKQYKGNFFYYFLFVGLSDPFALWMHSNVRFVPSNLCYVVTFFAALVSVISIDKKIRWKLVLSALIAIISLGFSIPNWDISFIMVAILVTMLYYSIRYMIIFAAKNRNISLFHFLFLIYNASLLIKLINAMIDPHKGAAYYFSTTIFEIFLGILLCFFREEDKRFAMKLRKY